MKATRGRPKLKPDVRMEVIPFRAGGADKAEYQQAADLAEQSLSDWIRDTLGTAAKRAIRKASRSS